MGCSFQCVPARQTRSIATFKVIWADRARRARAALLSYPLPIVLGLGAGRPSCGHHMVVALALTLTVYLPMVTIGLGPVSA